MFLFSSCATIKTASYKLDKSEPFSDKKTIRIVQISDFHSNDFGKNESQLIEKVRDASPDIIFLTGDIFDFDMKESLSTKVSFDVLNGTCCSGFPVVFLASRALIHSFKARRLLDRKSVV